MAYFQKENAELVNLSGCELIQSHFNLGSDYARSVALDYFTETAEQLLPPHEPSEKFFRLMLAVLAYLHAGGDVWAAVAYFSLWAVRLTGILPELRVTHESAEIANEIFERPLAGLSERAWSKGTAADMRRALIRTMEQHVERRFLTVPLLEAL